MPHRSNRDALMDFSKAQYDYDPAALATVCERILAADVVVNLCHPLGTATGAAHYLNAVADLAAAMPDLERRDFIRVAGDTAEDGDWVGLAGYFTGVMVAPWLDIPPTGHQVAMRYHEFFRFEGGQVVEIQAIWDIPELMMQCAAWPMAPSLGRTWQAPGPATQDGLQSGPRDAARASSAAGLVSNMLSGLLDFAEGGAGAMGLERYWHPKMNWYGPAGIGTNRGIAGFRHWHQIPFLKAMPDRRGTGGKGALFADGDYVGITGWPNMQMTLSGDGWMGIAPANQPLTMRSLDFWRCEHGLIRENWVLVDLLDVYRQLGVDVFERMRELTPVPLNRGCLAG
ncbi:polyketide cyclase [Litorivicinus lipolyticus]|uniref:Polyketide cyclase n=1 Tax=Litorivicinus lipolyticus TaxID=418701 RepID=A0A5Q2QE48_9GAMM|nr:ester cyclase [Litorivicinus lipolyticus]QGG80277.1 polyketide cyclase [Litorivicinus lipolyticus]